MLPTLMVPPLVKPRLAKLTLPVVPLPTTRVAPLPSVAAALGAENVPPSVVPAAAVMLVAWLAPLMKTEPVLTPIVPVKLASDDIVTVPLPIWYIAPLPLMALV